MRAPAKLTVMENEGMVAWLHVHSWIFRGWLTQPRVQHGLGTLVIALALVLIITRYAAERFYWSTTMIAGNVAAMMGCYVGLAVLIDPRAAWTMRMLPLGIVAAWGAGTALVARLAKKTVAERVAHRRRLDALRARADIGNSLSTATSLADLLELTVREVLEIYPFLSVAIYLVDGTSGKITHLKSSDEGDSTVHEVGQPLPPPGKEAMREARVTLSEVGGNGAGRTRTYVSLPGSPKAIGVISADVDAAEAELVDTLTDHLQAFASYAAVSLANAQLHQQIAEQERRYSNQLAGLESGKSPLPGASTTHRKIARLLPAVRKQQGEGARVSIVGTSSVIAEAVDLIRRVSGTDTTVLIRGESGTGKELAARAIHSQSPRSHGPFVAVNCAAIPESLIESELFGHEQGAFTGADHQRRGVFEQANMGTIFLDEVGEMPLSAQVRLLRVLQERTVTRVGGDEETKIDVRVIAATLKDLAQETTRGTFREDLFYRLNVFLLEMPPLRDRMDDLPLLVAHLMVRIASLRTLPLSGITEAAVAHLLNHRWPGNIRELENCLERALVLCEGELIESAHLVFDISAGSGREDDSEVGDRFTLPEMERRHISAILSQCGGNISETARRLGISQDNLRYRMKKYDISRRDDRPTQS